MENTLLWLFLTDVFRARTQGNETIGCSYHNVTQLISSKPWAIIVFLIECNPN